MKLRLRKIIGNQQIQLRKVVKCAKNREDVMPKFFVAYIIPHHDLNPRHKATWFNVYSDLFALFSQTYLVFYILHFWNENIDCVSDLSGLCDSGLTGDFELFSNAELLGL